MKKQIRLKRTDEEGFAKLKAEQERRNEERRKRQQEDYERAMIPIELADCDEFLEKVYGGRNAARRSNR